MIGIIIAFRGYARQLRGMCVDHWVGILFALLIGVSVLAPQLIWRVDERFRGIDLMGQDAEEHYIARVNDAYKGNLGLGNVFFPDKDKPYLLPPLGEIIQAGLSRIFFVTVTDGILLAKFIFPFLMAISIYALACLLSRSRVAALLGQASAMLGHLLMSGIKPWLDLIQGVLPIGSYTLFARPINPQISSLLMFIALFVMYRGFFLRKVPQWWEVCVVGVITGASLYISPYMFSFLGAAIAISCAWFFVVRDYPRALRTLYTGILALLVLIPFLINYIAFRMSPGSAELIQWLGLTTDHRPILSIWLVLMLLAVTFFWPKIYTAARSFFIVLILALWVVTEQHILTGLVLYPGHYHWYITKPLLGVMLGMYAVFLFDYFFKNKYLKAGAAGAIIFVLFYTSPLLHWRWYSENPDPPVVAAQVYAPALRALNALPGSQTVWADPGLSTYIPIYTKHNAPNNYWYAVYYLNPHSRYEHALFLEYRFAGETPSGILSSLKRDRSKVSERLFGLYYRQTAGDLAAIPDEILSELAEKYRAFYATPLIDVLKAFPVDVVVANVNDSARYDRMPDLHLFASVGSYNVYTVSK